MEYHVNQTNQPHELPKKKGNIVLDNLLGIWELQKLIAWRETAASSVGNKGWPPLPPAPEKKIKCRDYGVLEKRSRNLDYV